MLQRASFEMELKSECTVRSVSEGPREPEHLAHRTLELPGSSSPPFIVGVWVSSPQALPRCFLLAQQRVREMLD